MSYHRQMYDANPDDDGDDREGCLLELVIGVGLLVVIAFTSIIVFL